MKGKRLYIILLVLGLTPKSNGQAISQNGTFSIDFAKGCAPFTINITQILELDPTISRQYTYEDERTPTLNTSHTFDDPGTYNIAQILGQDANKFDTLTIEVLEEITPDFSINQCSGNGISVTPSGGSYDSYRVFFSATDIVDVVAGNSTEVNIYTAPGDQQIRVLGLFDGAEENCGEMSRTITAVNQLGGATITDLSVTTVGDVDGAMLLRFSLGVGIVYNLEIATDDDPNFEFLQSVSNSSNLTLSGLDTQNSSFCFRLSVTDACTNETFLSDVACSSNIVVEAMNSFHEVQLKRPAVFDGAIDIIKDGSLFATVSDPLQLVLIDSLVTCGTENCYVLNIDQGAFSFATTQVCATGISITSPPPINDITATVDGSNVILIWAIAENGVADTVVIRRARGRQSLSEISRSTVTEFVDPSPGVDRSTIAYDIFYTDLCGNQSSTSNAAQTIYLEAQNTTGNVYNLNWNEYTGWFSGVANYFLQRLDPSGNLSSEEKILSGFDDQVVLTNLDTEPVTFRVRAESLDLTPLESFSNALTFEFVPAIFIPGAFSPNDDGLNDVLEVEGTFVSSLKFVIYNRWGELLFFSEDRNRGWDGTIDQKNAPSGTYVYSLDFTDEQGKKFSKRGTFVLIR